MAHSPSARSVSRARRNRQGKRVKQISFREFGEIKQLHPLNLHFSLVCSDVGIASEGLV